MEDITDWGMTVISSGKYTGKTLKEICEIDEDYCLKPSYLRNNAEYPEFKKFIDNFIIEKVHSSEQNIIEMKLNRNSIPKLLEEMHPYHYVRLYQCFGGITIIHTKEVHNPRSYSDYIIKNNLTDLNGVFYPYVIKKQIYNLQNRDATNEQVEHLLIQPTVDCDSDYQIYVNKENKVLDILKQIYNISVTHQNYHIAKRNEVRDPYVDFDSEFVNLEHIKEVLNYTSSINNIETVTINPVLYNTYFWAKPDIISEDCIIKLKTSKKCAIDKNMFLPLILDALHYYISEKKVYKKFLIYNPLLGLEHRLVLENLDLEKMMGFFEEVIVQNSTP